MGCTHDGTEYSAAIGFYSILVKFVRLISLYPVHGVYDEDLSFKNKRLILYLIIDCLCYNVKYSEEALLFLLGYF